MELVSLTLQGNIHSACAWLNQRSLGEYLMQVYPLDSGYMTIAVLKVPRGVLSEVQKRAKS